MTLHSRFNVIAAHLDEAVDLAMRQLAEEVVTGAKSRVPVDTGKLRDAIHIDHRDDGEYAIVAGDTDAWYGHIVEHGGTKTPPHPFLIPAAEAARQHIDDRVRYALRNI
jgi:HK97 gp10 family phage protein